MICGKGWDNQTDAVISISSKFGSRISHSSGCKQVGYWYWQICDFGLARIGYQDLRSSHMTQEVVTQYYRAPEILMGARRYTAAIDIWSVGCIIAELLGRRVLFQANSPLHQVRWCCRSEWIWVLLLEFCIWCCIKNYNTRFCIFLCKETRFAWYTVCWKLVWHLCSLYVVRPSVCRLSVMFVRPTQAIEIFGNVTMPFGTLAICDLSVKILRRSYQGNPKGVKRKRGSHIEWFWTCRRLYLRNDARYDISYY